jgi:hypothetical protein
VRGHFSDGNSCGYSDLNKDFQTIVQDTDGTNEDLNTDCAELSIETHTVELNENSSILDNFFLRNDSERNFYLDELKVFDNDEYFMSIGQDFEKRADKDSGKAALYFKIQSFEDSAGHSGTATIQVKGHFSNGKTCSYTGIGKKGFIVNINAAPVAPPYVPPVIPTRNIEITNYPTRVDFNAHTFIAVTVKNNYSNSKTVNFGFSGFPTGLMLENTNYVIPANSSKTVYLDIDSKGNIGTFNGKLFIESDGTRQEKPITLIAGAATIATEPIDVQIQSSESKGSYDIVIKIKNNLEDSIQGTLSLDVPKEWIVSGLTEISLFSGQEKTTILHVVPNTPVSKETISMVSFKANGNEIKKAVSFKPTTSIVGTAFAVFSDSAVGIGILIIVIIALVFIWRAVAR